MILCVDKACFVLIAGLEFLQVDLETGIIKKTSEYEGSPVARYYDVYGLVGFIELLTAIHIILITHRKLVGQIQGKNAYMIQEVIILPLDFERAIKILDRYSWPSNNEDQESNDSCFTEEKNSARFKRNNIPTQSTSYVSTSTIGFASTRKFSEVWEGFIGDAGSPKVINVKDPIDKRKRATSYNLPLWEQVEKTFWWNEHMLKNLIKNEFHSWILPIMQGFVQAEMCEIEGREFDFILISRRSRDRAGLRYQRRGINENGDVANFVDEILHLVSFIQVRGSIPIFWSQSPYSLKPKPVLERSLGENMEAFKKHFDQLKKKYGAVANVNLTELNGREAIVGGAYKEKICKLNDNKIEYIEFDFHKECKGMKYENISKLVSSLHRNFNSIGYYWQAGDSEIHCRQEGVFRTNCMDCLDRTNVVQSAIAREVLNLQLLRLGVSDFIDNGISHYEHFENIFNDLWANNGDSISREYAGTSALKGDYTRNLQGVVNDASNSLARLFQNTLKDFFRQATIDYILGNHTIEVFQEIQQKFEASQPGDADRWAKVRATASNSSIVIIDNEEKLAGWTFLSPSEPNTLRGKSYEEKVILLTKKALYVCTFHYRLEKVMQFQRIGEYILSTLYPSCASPEDNYGFVVYYQASGTQRFMAFKAFRSNLVGEATKFDGGSSFVDEIVKACWEVGNAENVGFIVERPIISLEEASKNTGIMTKVGFRVKQALWL
ncbi:5090_t:CDS:10 [Entrophospora sp. SA101]|nr:5090_t:CDS:10 [Entrophospora sp. SA101]